MLWLVLVVSVAAVLCGVVVDGLFGGVVVAGVSVAFDVVVIGFGVVAARVAVRCLGIRLYCWCRWRSC